MFARVLVVVAATGCWTSSASPPKSAPPRATARAPRCHGTFVAETTSNRGSPFEQEAEAEPAVDNGTRKADAMTGPYSDVLAACPGLGDAATAHATPPYEAFVVLPACHAFGVRLAGSWWTHALVADNPTFEVPQFANVVDAAPGPELIVRTRETHEPPDVPSRYSTEELVICAVGASHVPSCIERQLGSDDPLPDHERVELECSGDAEWTTWQAAKASEGGGAFTSHVRERLAFP
jgi:hypothetical protein